MTENEAKAVKWMKNVRDDAVVTLDYIVKNEPNVSPMLYAGRKEKAETIINGFEELEQYRTIGIVEECRAAVEKRKPKKPIKDREQGIRYTSAYTCPSCGRGFTGTGIANYCYHCGQRLDWSDEDV